MESIIEKTGKENYEAQRSLEDEENIFCNLQRNITECKPVLSKVKKNLKERGSYAQMQKKQGGALTIGLDDLNYRVGEAG